MRPLARWTIGPVEKAGMEILRYSIKRFSCIYPEFDRVVCFNNIEPIEGLGCELVDQNSLKPISGVPELWSCGWKLMPPRLRMKSHELWIDNDIVILKRMNEIDEWLRKSTGIISEGVGQNYGKFHSEMGSLKLCAGLFGLPPNFDFESKIVELSRGLSKLGGFDEQGLVARTVSRMKGYVTVPQRVLKIVEGHHDMEELCHGFHFVDSNRKDYHMGWTQFKSRLI